MLSLRLTPSAIRNLVDVSEYSIKNWGESQALKYMLQLEDCYERLRKAPSGRKHDNIRNGLRSKLQGKHIVYYFVDDGEIVIINILHQAMDPLLHLDLPD